MIRLLRMGVLVFLAATAAPSADAQAGYGLCLVYGNLHPCGPIERWGPLRYAWAPSDPNPPPPSELPGSNPKGYADDSQALAQVVARHPSPPNWHFLCDQSFTRVSESPGEISSQRGNYVWGGNEYLSFPDLAVESKWNLVGGVGYEYELPAGIGNTPCSPTATGRYALYWFKTAACPAGFKPLYGLFPKYHIGTFYWRGEVLDEPTICKTNFPIKAKELGNCPTPFAMAGNPINIVNGNKYQLEIDLAPAGLGHLSFSRSYNSSSYLQRSVGKGWTHTYDRYITFFGSTAVVGRSDGRILTFRDPGTGVWTGDLDMPERLIKNGVEYSVFTSNDDLEVFDLSGRLIRMHLRDGATIHLTYSDSNTPLSVAPVSGLLISVTESSGRSLSFKYGSNRQVATLTDAAGKQTAYSYDGLLRLASVTYPDTKVRSYIYDETVNTGNVGQPWLLTGIVDENGARFATFAYDSTGRAVRSEHAGGSDRVQVSYGYDQTPTVIDALGGQRTVSLTTVAGMLRPLSSNAPLEACGSSMPASVEYDANGNLKTSTSFGGSRTRRTFDAARNLETTRVEADGTVDQRTTTTQWHATFRLPIRTAEPKRITSFFYNGDGGTYCAPTSAQVGSRPIAVLCKKTVQETTDVSGQHGFSASLAGTPRAWNFTYDGFGHVLTARDPNNQTTITNYYVATDRDPGKRGNIATITNPLGHVTQITAYDLYGRPLSMTDPNGMVTTMTYHPRGWLTSRTVGAETTSYEYDGVGQRTKVTQPDGTSLRYTYDGAHRLTHIQDGLGNRIVYTLDAVGNRIKEEAIDPQGTLSRTRQQVFDSLNRLHQTIGAQ